MNPATMGSSHELVLVANPEPIHVGGHLAAAAGGMGVDCTVIDVRQAYAGSRWRARLNWWIRRRRPCRLHAFNDAVVRTCLELRPTRLLATGIAPLTAGSLEIIGQRGLQRMCFLTDDPWNPAHRAPWFFRALPCYDVVFSPRRANIPDLKRLGCRHVSYLPFAYAPEEHYPDLDGITNEDSPAASDVLFVGGADRDRVPYLAACINSGCSVALYGGYWERFAATRAYARGHASMGTLRRATARAKVVLCLVRRANRDGHVMRSFEAAAMGACMLVEDTSEHREIFGPDSEAVAYFRTLDEMVRRLGELLANPAERQRLAEAVYRRTVSGANTYADRLATILQFAGTLPCH
jgi:hypothetical protein